MGRGFFLFFCVERRGEHGERDCGTTGEGRTNDAKRRGENAWLSRKYLFLLLSDKNYL